MYSGKRGQIKGKKNSVGKCNSVCLAFGRYRPLTASQGRHSTVQLSENPHRVHVCVYVDRLSSSNTCPCTSSRRPVTPSSSIMSRRLPRFHSLFICFASPVSHRWWNRAVEECDQHFCFPINPHIPEQHHQHLLPPSL